MPAVNPRFLCPPCSRGQHAYCTMEDICRCTNNWDGDGWKSIQDRVASKANVARLTTHPSKGAGASSESGPSSVGRRVWICEDCRYICKWWKGCERWRYCTECERRHLEIERRALALREKERGAETTDDASSAWGEAGQGTQVPLPLPAHRDGR